MRHDHDPSDAWWKVARELGAYAAHAALFGLGYLPSRHRPLRRRELRTVVFVHGVAANRAGFLPLQASLKRRGYDRQLAYNYATRGASIEALAVDLKRRIDRDVKGGRVDIVAHSMGGLVARTYLQLLGGDRRVDRLITLGTPHHGSVMTAWMPTRIINQLDPKGPFLTYLNALPPPERVRVIAVGCSEDMLVLPVDAAIWEHAEARWVDGAGHLDVLLRPAVWRMVGDLLDRPMSKGVSGVTEAMHAA